MATVTFESKESFKESGLKLTKADWGVVVANDVQVNGTTLSAGLVLKSVGSVDLGGSSEAEAEELIRTHVGEPLVMAAPPSEEATASSAGFPLPDDHFKISLSPEQEKEYSERLDKGCATMLELENLNVEGLNFVKRENDVDVYLCTSDASPNKMVVGVTVVPCTQNEILDKMVLDSSWLLRLVYEQVDKMFLDGLLIHTFPTASGEPYEKYAPDKTVQLPVTAVKWLAFNLPFPCWRRDFVVAETIRRVDENSIVSCGVSIEHPGAGSLQKSHGLVRGEMVLAGYVLREAEGGLKLTYVVQVDPKGWIPTAVVNLTAADQAGNAGRIRGYFETQSESQTHLEASVPEGIKSVFVSTDHVFHVAVAERGDFADEVPVKAGNALHWQFLTEENDIEFSATFDGETVVPKEKLSCHEQAVSGQWTAPRDGVVRLAWNNSYSWFTAKSLWYRHKVVCSEDSATAEQ